VNRFTGYNGGATFRGVTRDTIKITVRVTVDQGGASAQTSDELLRQVGQATNAEALQQAETLLPWFNRKYELYSRRVVFERFNGQGNSIDEAQDQGQEAACADATAVATSVKAFGDLLYGFTQESGPFTRCAARQQLMIPLAAPYFPESDYRSWDPYAWDNEMDCERVARQVAEYTGKRLLNRNARWAGDPTYRAEHRRFALYVPNDPPYQHCVDVFEQELKKYQGGSGAIVSRYNYALDVSQFPSEALRAMVQFQAAGATTVILACDNVSPIFMTQSAKQQGYHPEWLLIGVAATDTDGAARSYEPSEVNGHLFGMSELGDDAKRYAANGEAARAWAEATGGQPMQPGVPDQYYSMVHIFNLLQAAGPILTPEHLAAGARSLPPGGGAVAPQGTWSLAVGHVETIDSREIYWDPNALGRDGGSGHYIATYRGRRFLEGQWPWGDPPVYPNGSSG